jgi:hypothetical protein
VGPLMTVTVLFIIVVVIGALRVLGITVINANPGLAEGIYYQMGTIYTPLVLTVAFITFTYIKSYSVTDSLLRQTKHTGPLEEKLKKSIEGLFW